MGKIIVNETAKKNNKSTKKPLSSNEAEVISEEADSFDESRASQTSALVVAKPVAQKANRRPGKKSMSGMVMDVAPAARASRTASMDDSELEDNRETNDSGEDEQAESKGSRMKATIIAVVVALLVGLVGGLVVWFIGRDTTEYCTVQFESGGGTKIEEEKIACGNTIERPDDPTKDGFEFQDWLYDGMPFLFGTQSVNEDIKLVAKWLMSEGTEAVTVTFDSNGGSEVEEHVVAKGKPTTEPVAPTRDGYEFLGWFINGREFDFDKPINEDITVVAAWEKKPEEQKPSNNDKPNSSDENVKATAMKVSTAARTVKAGEEFEITVSVEPKNAKYNLAVRSQSDSVVSCSTLDAQASTKITCKAVAPGKTKVEIRDQNSNRTVSVDVTVEKVDVTGLTLSKSALTFAQLDVVEWLTATVAPSNATNKNVTWESSDEGVVKVPAWRIR